MKLYGCTDVLLFLSSIVTGNTGTIGKGMVDIWSIDIDSLQLDQVPPEIMQGIGEPESAVSMPPPQLRKEVRLRGGTLRSFAGSGSEGACASGFLVVR